MNSQVFNSFLMNSKFMSLNVMSNSLGQELVKDFFSDFSLRFVSI